MANTRTMFFNPTRIPLLLPPPPRPRSLTTVSSSRVGFTPITVHRRQAHHTFPVWKTKRTKMYGSLTPAASPDNGKTETSVKGEDHEVEYCSGKEEEEEEEEEDQSKNMIEHIKKVYGVLGVELLLYGVGYTIIAMNPPLIAFVDRNTLVFACLWFSTLLWMLPLPSKLNQGNKVQLKCINFCGILLNGLYLAQINVTGRTVAAASVSTLAMVSALTIFTFWAYGKRYYKLGIGYFLQFSSFVTMSTFLFAVFK